ncbi:MAG: hypothetical protein J5589_09290 [Firmicutes bacterium]|nr:hypothetical protein [Bacillota bacterium]
MLQFEVGKEFPLPRAMSEGAVFSVEPYTMILTYRFDKPTEEEIREFKTGTFQMAVTEERGLLFLLTKFGQMGWADAPYSTQLSERSKELPELREGHKGYSLDAFLVDLSTNTLTAHRLVRMSPDFSRKFRSLLLDDMAKDFDPSAYEKTVREVYRTYPTKVLLDRSLIRMKTDR